MLRIEVKFKEDPKRAFQRLKQLVVKEDVIGQVKKRRRYLKPSVAKRLKSKEAERQRVKDLKKDLQQAARLEQQLWE
jgi:ribosomal protein S21